MRQYDSPAGAVLEPRHGFGDEGKAASSFIAGGFAVCGFRATLTRDLYICCRNGLTESVPKADGDVALTHGFRVEAS